MSEYIDREAFIVDKKWLYCTDCDKRKGKKRGKLVTLYEIGEAPCKSCGIHDMLEEVEVYPAADAIEELSKYVNTMRRLKSEGWYLQQTKFHDGYHAVATMPLPEPPKEES